jgi:hypothetical protein
MEGEDHYNKPTTSRTLTDAEKKAQNAETCRTYRRGCTETKLKLQLQRQQHNPNYVPVDITHNGPSTSKTLTEAERRARNAEYARNFRRRCKEQNEQLQRQQQHPDNVTADGTNNKPSTSLTLAKENKNRHNAQYYRHYRQRVKEKIQQRQQQQAIICNVAAIQTEIQQQDVIRCKLHDGINLDVATDTLYYIIIINISVNVNAATFSSELREQRLALYGALTEHCRSTVRKQLREDV